MNEIFQIDENSWYFYTEYDYVAQDIENMIGKNPSLYSKKNEIIGYQFLINGEHSYNYIIKKYNPDIIPIEDSILPPLSEQNLEYNFKTLEENEIYFQESENSSKK